MSLSLLASLEGSLERHCSLCRIFERDQGGCDHTQSEPVLSMVNSESSFYTARTTTSVEVSASTLYRRPAVSRTVSEASFAVPQRGRTLRRRGSPTALSLRDLDSKHMREAARMRRLASEERLQLVYETQTLAYLEGPSVDLHDIMEP